MRFLLAILLSIVPLLAQPTLSNVEVTSSHGSVRIVFTTNDTGGARDTWIEYGTTPALGYSGYTPRRDVTVLTSGVRNMTVSGLAPDTQYYFRPFVIGATGTSDWRCTEGGSGWSCDPASGLGVFTTRSRPLVVPTPPEDIVALNTTMPAINGETFTVAVDGSNRCINFQQQLQACASADSSLNHQIMIPAGASCTGHFTLPRKVGSGTCVVRTAASDDRLPPEGVRIDPGYLPAMASLVLSPSQMGQIAGRAALTTPACSWPCTQGWRLVGLHITVEDPRTVEPIVVEIANITGNTITTKTPHRLEVHHQVNIAGVEGFKGRAPNGTWRISIAGPNSIRLQNAPPFVCATPSCHVPGTGQIVFSPGTRIAGASNTNPIVLTTAAPHGLSNAPAVPILSAENGILRLPADHGIPTGTRLVRIEGSSVPEYNKVWVTRGSSAETATLANPPSLSCPAECGTVTFKPVIHVAEVEGTTSANGNQMFTVLGPNELRLDEAQGNGDYIAGGILSFDPDLYFALLHFSETSDRIVMDRCYVNGRGFPNRTLYGIILNSTNSALIDSYMEGISSWRQVLPYAQTVETGISGLLAATSTAVEITSGSNKKISNNYLAAQGITIFSQEGSTGTVPENVEISRNRLYSDSKFMFGSPTSDGKYYPKRHLLELKRGRRFLITGNIFDGNWVDFTPCGPALGLLVRGSDRTRDNGISDINITNNIFRNTSSAIQVTGVDSYMNHVVDVTKRVRIHNNLIYDIDHRAWRSRPSATSPGLCGYAISSLWGVEDLIVTKNTALDVRGTQPQFFNYGYGRSSGVVVRDNLFTHNHENNAGALQPFNYLAGIKPSISAGTVSEAWEAYFPFGSQFSRNVVIPGVRSTSNPASYESSTPSLTFSKRDCENYYLGFRNIRCVGTDRSEENARERHESMFQDLPGRNLRLRREKVTELLNALDADTPEPGADIDAIESAVGNVRDTAVLNIDRSSATIAYVAPTGEHCHIDYTDDMLGTALRVAGGDDFGASVRQVRLDNLNSGTRYYFRIQCPSEQPIGSFETEM